ncbi:ComEC/Rec2 family competence protein [bacterium]|nr:ComEC/Rec2 family competence protein [bacterium]
MPRILNNRPILYLAVALMLGIFVGGLIFGNLILSIIIPIVIFQCGIIFCLFSKKFFTFLIFLAMAVGVAGVIIDYNVNIVSVDKKAVISGRVEEIRNGKKVVLSNFSVDGEEFKGKILINYKIGEVGDKISYYGKIKTNELDIFDTYAMSYYNDGIFYQSELYYLYEVSDGPLKLDEKVKNKFNTTISRYMKKQDVGIAQSLIFGDKSGLSQEDNTLIREAGVSHIFAVSGLHVGFLIALFVFIMKKLRLNRYVQLFTIIAVIVLYGVLCGNPPGLKRAGIMSVVYLVGNLLTRKNDSLSTLSLSVLLILIFKPFELFDIGFIMSVSAVFGIVLFYKPVYSFLAFKMKNKLYLAVCASFAMTISANAFLLPISFNVFNSFSLYMLFTNLFVVPLTAITYSLLVLTFVFSLIFEGFGVIYFVIKYPLIAIRAICKVFTFLPFASLPLSAMGIFTAVYIFCLILLSRFIMIKPKYKGITVLSLISLSGVMFLL